MCVLYVMLTRAVHAIHIIVSHGAKPDHKSPAGVLVSTLTDGNRAEGTLYEKGDPKWYQTEDAVEPAPTDAYQLETFYLPGKVQLKPARVSKKVSSQRGLPKILPSLVSEGDQVDLSQAFHSWGNLASLERGRILHGCFERLNWADENLPTSDQLESFLRSLAPSVADFKPYIDDFYRLLDLPKIKNLFSRRGYETTYMGLAMVDDDQVAIEPNRVEVCTERRFAVATDSGFLQGVIDRMVLIFRGDQLIGADIIDLKTEHLDSTQLHDHINRHRPQLQAYRTAAATFLRLPVERISTRLVFIESGQIVNLHAIEGAIDFSPNKKRPARKAAPKKPIRMTPVADKAGSEIEVVIATSDEAPMATDAAPATSDEAPAASDEPLISGKAQATGPPHIEVKQTPKSKTPRKSKVKSDSPAEKPPAKTPVQRQKTLWD